MQTVDFGMTKRGGRADLFIIKNKNGMEISVTDYGAHLVTVKVPGKDGKIRDIVLGYDDVSSYESEPYCFGATIGRNANRIENACFTLNGKLYQLARNEYENNSHSGPGGYQYCFWNVKETADSYVIFSLESPDLDQGFPGNFNICVTYELTDDNEIRIHYEGICDKDTIVNMTHHSYFNLNGHNSGNILNQLLRIHADKYSPVKDDRCIPTGVHASVIGTPMDFTRFKRIGEEIDTDFEQLKIAGDYNHSYILNKQKADLEIMAEAYCEESGISMKAYTDLPAMQLYTGIYISEPVGKDGFVYGKRSGFCLEAQYTPNAINEENEKKPILSAGVKYDKMIIYNFSPNI